MTLIDSLKEKNSKNNDSTQETKFITPDLRLLDETKTKSIQTDTDHN